MLRVHRPSLVGFLMKAASSWLLVALFSSLLLWRTHEDLTHQVHEEKVAQEEEISSLFDVRLPFKPLILILA